MRTHVFYEGAGCIECGGTGFGAARPSAMDLTDRIRDMILERRPTSEIKRAARVGMTFASARSGGWTAPPPCAKSTR
jgi:type IV pilus assembly protein PilB